MKNLTDLKEKGTKLSKSNMKKIGGGYSRFYCTIQFLIGNLAGGVDYDDCRSMRD